MRYNEIIIKRKMTPDGAASRNANSGIGKVFYPIYTAWQNSKTS